MMTDEIDCELETVTQLGCPLLWVLLIVTRMLLEINWSFPVYKFQVDSLMGTLMWTMILVLIV